MDDFIEAPVSLAALFMNDYIEAPVSLAALFLVEASVLSHYAAFVPPALAPPLLRLSAKFNEAVDGYREDGRMTNATVRELVKGVGQLTDPAYKPVRAAIKEAHDQAFSNTGPEIRKQLGVWGKGVFS